MTDYCHQTDGFIDEGRKPLPRAWRNISGLDKASTGELKSWGWLPIVYVNEAYTPVTQVRTGPTGCNIGDAVPVGADEVTGVYALRDKTQQEVDVDREQAVIRIKAEAGRRILLIVPEWKQRNLLSEAVVLLDKGRAQWTPEEVAMWAVGEVMWLQAKAIRAKSDELESQVATMSAEGLALFDTSKDAVWE
jgi:hypothetical protein|tara:strand:- start:407 stop:979 length:573 start_codon:yes stop_codon:yes gene_type:complete